MNIRDVEDAVPYIFPANVNQCVLEQGGRTLFAPTSRHCELGVIEVGIETVLCHKLVVTSLLYYMA